MLDREKLCEKIREIFPDIGECGIDIDVDFDKDQERWVVDLRKGGQTLQTFLEEGDAEYCMAGKQCVSLGIEIAQLKDSLARRP